MFSPNVVGTANATAAGWGNLGGGVTQIFMISVLFKPMIDSGIDPNTAWRVAMIVPAVLFVLCAVTLKLLCWDTPTAKRFDVAVMGKSQKPSLWDYVEVLKDIRVVVMIMQLPFHCHENGARTSLPCGTSSAIPRAVSGVSFSLLVFYLI